jgi:hypothetical protein
MTVIRGPWSVIRDPWCVVRGPFTAAALAAGILFATADAQVGRGGSEWLTAGGDAQRTSWIRTDALISVDSMSKPGFELQWKQKLENANRETFGLGPGVTANGVTLFVPMSVVTGSSNNVYAIDNDLGYIVWQRHFDAALPAPTSACPGGTTSAATRIVSLAPPPISPAGPPGGGRAGQSYRSVLGEPGEGAPVEVRGRAGPPPAGAPNAAGPGRGPGGAPQSPAGAPTPGTPPQAPAGAAQPAPQRGGPGGGRGPAGIPIPGAPADQVGRGGYGRPSGVFYAISSDGVLHVMGLPSGKDIQKPAPFVPANSRWSDPIAVGTTLYTSTSGGCGGAPNAIWAIDLDSESKPVVSWKSGGPIVGSLALTTDGSLVAAIGPATGGNRDGKPNAIVTLDAKTLQVKDSFNASGAEFVTGPTIFRQGDRELIAAGTKDGRMVLLDAASPGGANHSATLSTSTLGGTAAADSLASWQQMTGASLGTRWILAPLTDSIAALQLADSGGTLTLSRGWSARLTSPETPIVVNGVVFVLEPGRGDTAATLHAYEGASGKELWTSGKTMTSPAAPASFWSSSGQIYVGTMDGTVYAFGFNDERR